MTLKAERLWLAMLMELSASNKVVNKVKMLLTE